MRVLEVIINDTTIDVESRIDFPLLLKKQILSFGQVDSRGDVTSFTVKFPSTEKNLTALKLNLNLDNYGKFYNTENYETTILVNSIELMRGIFILTSFNDNYIEGYIQSTAIGQSRLIGNKKLNELNFPTIPFLGMETIIENQSDQTIDPINHSQNSIICFPPVSYGTYFVPYKQTSGHTIDVTNYSIGITAEKISAYDVPKQAFEDLAPSVYVRAIMRQIFNDIGYTLSGSQINSDELNTLIMPFTAFEKVNYNWNTIAGYTATSNIDTTYSALIPFTIGAFTNNAQTEIDGYDPVLSQQTFTNNYSLSHLFTTSNLLANTTSGATGFNRSSWFSPTKEITYKLSGSIEVEQLNIGVLTPQDYKLAFVTIKGNSDNNTSSADFVANIIGNQFILDLDSVVQEQAIPTSTLTNGIVTYNFDVDFTPDRGDMYKMVLIKNQTNKPIEIKQNSTQTVQAINSTDDFTLQEIIDPINNINHKGNLQDINQLDFVKNMISLFNLFFYVDESKKLIIFEPQDNFYSPKQSAYELRGKMRLIEQVTDVNKFLFEYTNDSKDFLTDGDTDQNYNKETFLRIRKENQEIVTKFSKTELQNYIFLENQSVSPADPAPTYFQNFQRPVFFPLVNGSVVTSIDIPQISGEDAYQSLQSDVYDDPAMPSFKSLVDEAYVTQNRKFNMRLLRLTNPYVFVNSFFPLFNQNTITNSAEIIYSINIITQATNENLTQEYFYDNHWFSTIQEYERSELVTFEVYIDYTDYVQLQSNRLILIDGIFYRLIEFAPFNPLNPKPIILKLLKVF